MHIAILDTDVPVPAVYSTRGLYSTQFRTLLQAAANRLNARNDSKIDIQTSAYDAVGGVLPPFNRLRTSENHNNNNDNKELDDQDIIDGILITGSANASYEKDTKPWIANLEVFIREVYERFPAVRMFGSCFGHQIIAQALFPGVLNVEQCPLGHEFGIVPITLDDAFNESFPHIADSLRQRNQQRFRLQLVHGDRVVPVNNNADGVKLPSPWFNLGYTEKCPIHGLYNPRRVLTYQGHFEFDAFVNRESCVEFGRRLGWDKDAVEGLVQQINVALPAAGEGKEDDDDDSKAAAEAVVLLFAER